MYKFTNGIVVFDKETRDKYINAGMTLVEEEKANGKESGPNGLEEHRTSEEGVKSNSQKSNGRSNKINSKVRK